MLTPLNICHHCDRRQPNCAGACACTVNGRDIIENAQARACPLNRFTECGDAIPLPAGEAVERIAARIGLARLAKVWERWTGRPCGCAKRKAALNAAHARLASYAARPRPMKCWKAR